VCTVNEIKLYWDLYHGSKDTDVFYDVLGAGNSTYIHRGGLRAWQWWSRTLPRSFACLYWILHWVGSDVSWLVHIIS